MNQDNQSSNSAAIIGGTDQKTVSVNTPTDQNRALASRTNNNNNFSFVNLNQI